MKPTFETVLTALSTRFTGLAAEAVDAEVESALRCVVEGFGTDRSSLFLVRPDEGIEVTHSWARPGLGLEPVTAATSGRNLLPWYHRTLARGEPVVVSRLPEGLPSEATREREFAQAIGMKSNLAVLQRLRDGGADIEGASPYLRLLLGERVD